MSTKLGLSHTLKSLVTNKFQRAKQAKEVVFSETQLTTLHSVEIGTFQLRYLPALAKKPTDNNSEAGLSSQTSSQAPPSKSKPKARYDPFENPSEELLVAQVPATNPSHNLVLNKFPVIPNHFILATRENKPQDHPLEVDDLTLTYECIRAWQNIASVEGFRPSSSAALFAFFNSGINSGASQPHRHVQFLPVEDMNTHDDNDDEQWSLLVNSMAATSRTHLDLLVNPSLPIIHYAIDIAPDISPQDLQEKYLLLLRASWATIAFGTADIDTHDLARCNITQPPDTKNRNAAQSTQDPLPNQTSPGQGKVGFDYNLCLTIDKMAIIPRLRSDAQVPLANPPQEDNQLSVNGTILAGTLMTKSERHWRTLKDNPDMMTDLLKQVGYPKPTQALL